MAKASSPKLSGKPPASFEAAQMELEQLVAQLESGDMPLDKLLSAYQRGSELLAFCRGQLDAVQEQVRLLDGAQNKPFAVD